MTTVPEMIQRSIIITDTPVRLTAEIVGRIFFENTSGKIVGVKLFQNDIAGADYQMPGSTTYQLEGLENADQVEVRNAQDSTSITLYYTVYGQ